MTIKDFVKHGTHAIANSLDDDKGPGAVFDVVVAVLLITKPITTKTTGRNKLINRSGFALIVLKNLILANPPFLIKDSLGKYWYH
jgi:hypothetical protein